MRGSATPEIERALTALRERRRVAVSLPHWSVAPAFISGTDLILKVASRGLRDIDEWSLVVAATVSYSVVYVCIGVARR